MFREEKVTAAAWWLVKQSGGSMPHIKLMKLLYFVEREWLLERGVSLFGDKLCSMAEGPVLSATYDSMKRTSVKTVGRFWRTVLSPISDRTITKVADLDPSQFLTRAQLGKLRVVWEARGSMTEDEIVELGHQLPEWENPGSSSSPISVRTILEREGFSPKDVGERERTLETQRAIGELFGS